MTEASFREVFTPEVMNELFPPDRSDQFFEAMFGDTEEGAYDISLEFENAGESLLCFKLLLKQRPEKCLVCNLTYGLPNVFARHPVINLDGLMTDINRLLDGKAVCTGWSLGKTDIVNNGLHTIPLEMTLEG